MSGHLKVGDMAPEFSLRTVDGSTVSLSDFSNKPVVLLLLRSLT